MKLYTFTVRGPLSFPLDMLRHGACWPHDAGDVEQMHAAMEREPGIHAVTLISIYEPNPDRWSSFGWEIVSSRRI